MASRRFPVTVSQLPTVSCDVCGTPIPHRRGEASAQLTAHYEREHADVIAAARPD